MMPMAMNWKLFEDMHASPDDLPWLNWLRRGRSVKSRGARAGARLAH